MAFLKGLVTIVREMASETKETNKTLLHLACSQGDAEYLRALLDNGFDIEAKDVKQQTPLFAACDNEDPACIQLLLEKGANPNVTNMVGQTPLHMACLQSKIDYVRLLHCYGAAMFNARDLSGRTPLIEACIAQDVECVRFLLNNGAIPDVVDRSGLTPMQIVTTHLHMQKQNSKAAIAVTDALLKCKEMLQEALEKPKASRKRPRVEDEEEEEEPIAKRTRHALRLKK